MYTFTCTQRQVENYLFKFGHDARILAPQKSFRQINQSGVLNRRQNSTSEKPQKSFPRTGANFHFSKHREDRYNYNRKRMPKGRSFSSTVRNRSDSAGAAQNTLIRRFFA